MIFEQSLHESVCAVYRDIATRSGNTVEAFTCALAVVRKARPEMAVAEARREVAAMISTEPEATLRSTHRRL